MQAEKAYSELLSLLLVLYSRCAFSNIADVITQMSLLPADISSFSTCRWYLLFVHLLFKATV